MRIIRPGLGTITSVGGGRLGSPPAARGRTAAGAQWLDDERYRGRTDALILDTRLGLLGLGRYARGRRH